MMGRFYFTMGISIAASAIGFLIIFGVFD